MWGIRKAFRRKKHIIAATGTNKIPLNCSRTQSAYFNGNQTSCALSMCAHMRTI